MAQLPELRGRFVVGTGQHTMNVSETATTINAGTYYTAGIDGESNAYINDIQTQIRTVPGQGNALVNYYPANGGVVITMNAATNFSMQSIVADSLGFSTGVVNIGTLGGSQVPKHVWRPSRGLSDHPVELNVFWSPRSTTIIGRSVDGTTYSREGNTLYDAEISFDKLPRADVMTPDSGFVGNDLQTFFEDIAAKGQIVRVFPERNATASANVKEALWGSEEDEELGTFNDYLNRHVNTWFALFDVTIPFMKKV